MSSNLKYTVMQTQRVKIFRSTNPNELERQIDSWSSLNDIEIKQIVQSESIYTVDTPEKKCYISATITIFYIQKSDLRQHPII